MWKLAVETTLGATRPAVLQYWNFVIQAAEGSYHVRLGASIMQKIEGKCLVEMPRCFEDIELYLHSRVRAVMPVKLK